jgi:pimeloyl-ACP methyl ester carboxylesterase
MRTRPASPHGERSTRLPQTLPGLRRSLIIPGGGHWIGEEHPDEINAALLEFLAGL